MILDDVRRAIAAAPAERGLIVCLGYSAYHAASTELGARVEQIDGFPVEQRDGAPGVWVETTPE